MALSGKMIGRITKTTVNSTHTANAIRAHTNGGFSSRSSGANRPVIGGGERTVAGYGQSMIGRSSNSRPKALTADELQRSREIRNNNDGRNMSYTRAAEEARSSLRQERSAGISRSDIRGRSMAGGNRFDTGRNTGGRFGQPTGLSGSNRPMLGGAANATARPVPTPTFRRPM